MAFGRHCRSLCFSLGNQVQVPPVYGELRQRSLRRISIVLLLVGLVCLGLYSAIAVAGLLAAFEARGGGTVVLPPGNVLDTFSAKDTGGLVMRLIMATACSLVYPMLCVPTRSTMDHLIFGIGDGDTVTSPAIRNGRLAMESLVIVSVTFFFETRDSDLASVFGLTGASAGSLVLYILPPACYLRLRSFRPQAERVATRLLAALGMFTLAFVAPVSAAITWQHFSSWFS